MQGKGKFRESLQLFEPPNVPNFSKHPMFSNPPFFSNPLIPFRCMEIWRGCINPLKTQGKGKSWIVWTPKTNPTFKNSKSIPIFRFLPKYSVREILKPFYLSTPMNTVNLLNQNSWNPSNYSKYGTPVRDERQRQEYFQNHLTIKPKKLSTGKKNIPKLSHNKQITLTMSKYKWTNTISYNESKRYLFANEIYFTLFT